MKHELLLLDSPSDVLRWFYMDSSGNHIKRDLISEELMLAVFQNFGGIDAFAQDPPQLELEYLLFTLLVKGSFPAEVSLELLEKKKSFTTKEVYALAFQPLIFTDVDYFKKLWSLDVKGTFEGLLDKYIFSQVELFDNTSFEGYYFSETNSFCFKDFHYACEDIEVFLVNNARRAHENFKRDFFSRSNPEIINFVQDNFLSLPQNSLKNYSAAGFVREDQWKILVEDQDLLRSLASNFLLPTEWAWFIFDKDKNPIVLKNLALTSCNKKLLDSLFEIGDSYVRSTVQRNSVFNGIVD